MRREQFYQLPQFTYYTFNAAENGKPMLNGSFAGQQNGLKLRLNIERESYIPNLIWPSVGIIILIHDQNSFPIVEDFGIAVPPGMSTTCAIRRRNVSARKRFLKIVYQAKCFVAFSYQTSKTLDALANAYEKIE